MFDGVSPVYIPAALNMDGKAVDEIDEAGCAAGCVFCVCVLLIDDSGKSVLLCRRMRRQA